MAERVLWEGRGFAVAEVDVAGSGPHPFYVGIDAVAVVALDGASGALLIEEFRAAAGGTILHLPMGKLKPGEPPADAAVRELREETGFTASSWTALASVQPNPGWMRQTLHLFAAEGLRAGQPEDDPAPPQTWAPLSEVGAWVRDGRLVDARTIAALLLAAALL